MNFTEKISVAKMNILPLHKLNQFIPEKVCGSETTVQMIMQISATDLNFFCEQNSSTGALRDVLNSPNDSRKKEALARILAVRPSLSIAISM